MTTTNHLPVKYRKLQYDLEKILTYAKGYQAIDIDCTDVMKQWYQNKRRFIDLFQGQLIYEFPEPIEIELNDNEKHLLFVQFLAKYDNEIDNGKLRQFLERNEKGFFDNVVVNDDFNIKRLRAGDKLLKSFKYFSRDEYQLRKAQDLASQYIQEAKIKGILCASIHPFDFMTISENNCGWRSCHALDGEYSGGNMNYMVDETTFVLYLKREKDEQLKCFPNGILWNSKKWRVLAHWQKKENCIWFNKQYPFKCNTLLNKFYDLSDYLFDKRQFNPIEYVGIEEFVLNDGTRIPAQGTHLMYFQEWEATYEARDIIINHSEAFNYNDILSAFYGCPAAVMCKKGRYLNRVVDSRFYTWDVEILLRTEVGQPFKPICGCDAEIDEDDGFVCHQCAKDAEGGVNICECCNRVIYPEEEVAYHKVFDNEEVLLVCPECKKYLINLEGENK